MKNKELKSETPGSGFLTFSFFISHSSFLISFSAKSVFSGKKA
jgi:hypothetical protein